MAKKPTASRSITNQFRRHYLIASIIPIVFLLVLIATVAEITRNYLADLITQSTYDLNQDTKSSLQQLGEEIIMAKATDVAKEIEMYFRMHPDKTFPEMRNDPLFMGLAIQKVGKTGYTALTEVNTWLFLVHPNANLNDTDMRPLANKMPDWWKIIQKATATEITASGYYDWREPDGSYRKKFMVVTPVGVKHRGITIWVSATTYIDEFLVPVLKMKDKADAITGRYQQYVSERLVWFSGFAGIIIVMLFVGTYLWDRRVGLRYITPIAQLAETAKQLGEGNWEARPPDRVLQREDEIGVTAQSFAHMADQLKDAFLSLEQRVSEIKQTQDALKASEEKYRKIFEDAIEGVYQTTPEGRYLSVNPAFARMFNYASPQEMIDATTNIGQQLYVNPKDREELVRILYEHDKVEGYEVEVYRKDRSRFWISINTHTVRDASGNLLYFEGTNMDITERKQAEHALRESEEKFSRIFRTSPDIITINRLSDSMYLDVNDQYTKQAGYTREETIGKSAMDLGIWADFSDRDRIVEIIRTKGEMQGQECRLRCKDGTIKNCEISARIITLSGDLCILALIRDITEKLETQRAQMESEAKYRLLAEQSLMGMHIIQGGVVKYANRATSDITGYSIEEMMNWSPNGFAILLHPDDMPFIMEQARKKQMGDPNIDIHYEWRIINKSGVVRWVESFSKTITFEGSPADFVMMIDITDRREAIEKQQSLEERLNRAEKMEALGTLAGGVAHDLNNVLGIVIGYAEMLLMDAAKTSSIKPRLVKILEGGQKAAAIVQDMLTLARRSVPTSQVLNLNKIIMDYRQSPEFALLASYHPLMQLKTDLALDLLNISGSSVHLDKTLFNLVSNASEAMPRGGIVTIKTASEYLDKPIQGYEHILEGDYVVLSVSDTGEGISAVDLKRIFEPFYTKKVMGRSGTGLGLAVVWGTVKDHNGYINVQSTEGEGSTFTLYFPASREDIPAEAMAISMSEYMGRGESILIVDDVEDQRELAAGILRKLNYRVEGVSSGEEAIEYLKDHHVDLIILDMIMDPGIDGLDTFRGVLKSHPEQKAIIVSGFSESDRVKAAQEIGAGAYVRKPYIIEKLGLAVRHELDRQ